MFLFLFKTFQQLGEQLAMKLWVEKRWMYGAKYNVERNVKLYLNHYAHTQSGCTDFLFFIFFIQSFFCGFQMKLWMSVVIFYDVIALKNKIFG